ncbi:TIGR02300 family protein [Sphingomonas bacterium]|uniref:TIGR02300 family protein n=1 Tax=Sphingomonas bacterium TaxID=1895847 RepID=UPI001577435B|nr:TIGR02300 family protein [Sphingomonas bacterium]
MVKPEWGTKRTCPQTGERFYDLGKDNPVTSPNGVQWYPEPVLKSKQPLPFDAPKPVVEKVEEGSDLADELVGVEDEEPSADDDVDLGGDDDIGVDTGADEDEH